MRTDEPGGGGAQGLAVDWLPGDASPHTSLARDPNLVRHDNIKGPHFCSTFVASLNRGSHESSFNLLAGHHAGLSWGPPTWPVFSVSSGVRHF